MINFTFNTLDRIGLVDKLYVFVANLANKYVLSRHNFDTQYIADVFNAVDGFWLKYGRTERYNDNEIRVIVGSIVEMLRDNELTSDEVRKLSRYVMAKWKPELAEEKITAPAENLLTPVVEEVAKKSVKVYRELPPNDLDVTDFVAVGTKIIADKLPDNEVLNTILGALKAK
ncbi:hypothetical protein [Vulcanococcus sp.]|uniref:hypothetical protein n=1 Tax=Vulcanococcus sp. TaxID=2856995 RepID=UPI003F6A3C75